MSERKTARELKAMARTALLGHYGNLAGAFVIMEFIMIAMSVPGYAFNMWLSIFGGSGFSQEHPIRGVLLLSAVTIIFGILGLVVSQALSAGYTRLCYETVSKGESNLNALLFAVRNHFGRFIGLWVRIFLIYMLWMVPMTLVIAFSSFYLIFMRVENMAPGVFAAVYVLWLLFWFAVAAIGILFFVCRYALAYLSLVEDPEQTVREVLIRSKEMIRGNRWRMAKFELSFLGIYLLGLLSFGIGLLWAVPYMVAGNICFYQALKEETFCQAVPVSEEMPDESGM